MEEKDCRESDSPFLFGYDPIGSLYIDLVGIKASFIRDFLYMQSKHVINQNLELILLR